MIWQYLLVITCSAIAGSPFLMAQHEQIRRVRNPGNLHGKVT